MQDIDRKNYSSRYRLKKSDKVLVLQFLFFIFIGYNFLNFHTNAGRRGNVENVHGITAADILTLFYITGI